MEDNLPGFICQNQSFLHWVALVKPSVPTACKKKKKSWAITWFNCLLPKKKKKSICEHVDYSPWEDMSYKIDFEKKFYLLDISMLWQEGK